MAGRGHAGVSAPGAISNLAINPERLWGEIMETAAIGGTARAASAGSRSPIRPAGARLFRARAEALGCRVTVDDMGAMFARRGPPTCRRS